MQRYIKIPSKVGYLTVPASPERPEIPHLAVTMTQFGLFEVTHVPSGYKLVGGFERACNAFIAMAEAQLAFNELQIDSSLDHIEFTSEASKKDKYCKALGMTFLQWINIHKTIEHFSDEFPWEDQDDNPHTKLEKLMKELANQ
ncbi:hypothetical protein [Photobacterium damselae]|uniref:hypothetical protein n=1 Tax=Photobacterium damselae TaxID=38293 RepID=UPI001F3B14DF|nr:hypothetical protein [Photobacterium damselae]UKA04979.1 hypothetical protein IHC89_22295 [Photobacterium damselae subsp. damselae]